MELNWDAIGAVGEILGTVAVMITLLYLARQLNHAVESSHSTATDRLIRRLDEINRMIVIDASLRDTLLKKRSLANRSGNPMGDNHQVSKEDVRGWS